MGETMKKRPVLGDGYVGLVERWGTDERIIESARMSTAKGFLGWGDADKPGDEKLLAHLWHFRHLTPFEMAGATLEIKLPIFVVREWHRHRTQSYNEMSARYVALPDVCFVPDALDSVARSQAAAATHNRQAGVVAGAEVLTLEVATTLLDEERVLLALVESLYQRKLRAGFPKELARTHLSVSRYTCMRASANLRNWLGFLSLRDDKAAQAEIRAYAGVVCAILTEEFPRVMALYAQGRGA